MIDPLKVSIQDYQYNLPEEKIARYPLSERDASKLLVWNNGTISDRRFRELPDVLKGNLLILNNTKVISARLQFYNINGGRIEIFVLEPEEKSDPQLSLGARSSVRWRCMVGRVSKWKDGTLQIKLNDITLSASLVKKEESTYIIEFSWTPDIKSFAEILQVFGNIPLPPYLNREAEAGDEVSYQTIYAKYSGSVAAPTAGLHFTPEIEKSLDHKHIDRSYVTLHVGAGTFRPVNSATLEGHEMHSELIEVSLSLINKLSQQNPEETTAVGTTTLRTLESLYWLSVILKRNPQLNITETEIDQWYPYQYPCEESFKGQMKFLADMMNESGSSSVMFHSKLLIAPGYKIRSCGGLITNFHQPSSTLLLLVAAVTDNDWKNIYQHALDNGYRFLSYGDSSYLRFQK